MKRLHLVIGFLLVFTAQALISCKDNVTLFERSIIWEERENNMDGYRIPGIIAIGSGTVLAFSEERPTYGDSDPKSIVLKRSRDKGVTWSDNIYIEKADGSYWRGHPALVDAADVKDKKEVWTNIAPLFDKEIGRVFFFYALSEGAVAGHNLQRYTRVFYKYSDDDGLTWSGRVEVTDILNAKKDGTPNQDKAGNWITDENGFPCDYLGRAFHMPGPGHGIQLSGGRLLLQIWNRKPLGLIGGTAIPVDERNYGICTIYSDDHGKTWNYGSSFGHDGLNMNESRMVELDNGDIYLNSRYTGERNNYRAIALSHDRGITWTNLRVDKSFPLSSSCDAGLARIKRDGKQFLLYSKNESLDGRKNLVVRLSDDGGKHWNHSSVVDPGPASYSDMAVLSDNSILLIYETGKNSPVYGVRFNLEWVLNGKSPLLN